MTIQEFVRRLAKVMRQKRLVPQDLAVRAPKGLWAAFAEAAAMKEATARSFWSARKDEALPLLRGIFYSVATKETVKGDKRAKAGAITREETARLMQELETRLTKMVNDKLRAALATRPPSVESRDLPPATPKEGKKFKGSKEDLRVRIDSELWRLLDDECARDLAGNMSRCLDAVLWRYYGRPRLSFEEPEPKGRRAPEDIDRA